MSDDTQKETERIHQGIVESLSFSEALANRDAEIARLRKELEGADRVANSFAQKACQRGARMQLMREWMLDRELNGCDAAIAWWAFVEERPEADGWFYEDGTAR
jgi:hypothetical protein